MTVKGNLAAQQNAERGRRERHMDNNFTRNTKIAVRQVITEAVTPRFDKEVIPRLRKVENDVQLLTATTIDINKDVQGLTVTTGQINQKITGLSSEFSNLSDEVSSLHKDLKGIKNESEKTNNLLQQILDIQKGL